MGAENWTARELLVTENWTKPGYGNSVIQIGCTENSGTEILGTENGPCAQGTETRVTGTWVQKSEIPKAKVKDRLISNKTVTMSKGAS